jgi:hypothetical protein
MLPLYRDPHFTFRFADDRAIARFRLEGVEAGRHVEVHKIDPGTGERLGLLATATVGEDGWVELPGPITVRAGEAFVAVPEPGPLTQSLCRSCQNVREVRTARSRFWLCGLSVADAAYPKYPPQPVLRCDGYEPRPEAAPQDRQDDSPGPRT